MSRIDFSCPHCKASLHAPNKLGGRTARCNTCQNTLTIPPAAANSQTPPLLPKHATTNSRKPLIITALSGMAAALLILLGIGIGAWVASAHRTIDRQDLTKPQVVEATPPKQAGASPATFARDEIKVNTAPSLPQVMPSVGPGKLYSVKKEEPRQESAKSFESAANERADGSGDSLNQEALRRVMMPPSNEKPQKEVKEKPHFDPRDIDASRLWFFELCNWRNIVYNKNNAFASDAARKLVKKKVEAIQGQEIEWSFPVRSVTENFVKVSGTNNYYITIKNQTFHPVNMRGTNHSRCYLIVLLADENGWFQTGNSIHATDGFVGYHGEPMGAQLLIGKQISKSYAMGLKDGSVIKIRGKIKIAKVNVMDMPELRIENAQAVE